MSTKLNKTQIENVIKYVTIHVNSLDWGCYTDESDYNAVKLFERVEEQGYENYNIDDIESVLLNVDYEEILEYIEDEE